MMAGDFALAWQAAVSVTSLYAIVFSLNLGLILVLSLGGGAKIQNLFLSNFLTISDNLEQTLFCFVISNQIFSGPHPTIFWRGGGLLFFSQELVYLCYAYAAYQILISYYACNPSKSLCGCDGAAVGVSLF